MFTQRTRVWHRSGSDQSRFLLTRQTHADTGIIPPSERLRLFGRRNKKRCECEGSGRPPPPRRLRAFEDASCSHINFYVWWQKPSKDVVCVFFLRPFCREKGAITLRCSALAGLCAAAARRACLWRQFLTLESALNQGVELFGDKEGSRGGALICR